MSEIKAFSSASVEAELKYRESLSVLNSSYRYREQNLPRTIELIDRAKGTKSIRRYADELGMNAYSTETLKQESGAKMSDCILGLSGKSQKMGN